jgi:DNA-binding NarL/FixJ family response regulator
MAAERKLKLRSKKRRVVVADDDPSVLQHISEMLESCFDVVARARDGLALLKAVKSLAPCVVVTDIAMPELSGIEATRIIVQRYPAVKVVVVSGYDETAFVDAVFSAGASGYVWKVDAQLELVPAVNEVLRGRVYRSAGIR